jgi:hemolysin III
MQRLFKDPVSGLTHLAGAFLGLWGLVYFGGLNGKSPQLNFDFLLPFFVFGISVVAMYLSSATYHLLHVSDQTRRMLRRVDHTMIFLLIAGSYTPYCMITLREGQGFMILMVVWSLAILGLGLKLIWLDAPRWLSTALYVGMGWISILAIVPLAKALSLTGLLGLFGGGVSYTVGAVIYALKRPDPFPPHFGFHEIWHLFVLLGTGLHYLSICTLLP